MPDMLRDRYDAFAVLRCRAVKRNRHFAGREEKVLPARQQRSKAHARVFSAMPPFQSGAPRDVGAEPEFTKQASRYGARYTAARFLRRSSA